MYLAALCQAHVFPKGEILSGPFEQFNNTLCTELANCQRHQQPDVACDGTDEAFGTFLLSQRLLESLLAEEVRPCDHVTLPNAEYDEFLPFGRTSHCSNAPAAIVYPAAVFLAVLRLRPSARSYAG